jgi:hypothetical protein
MMTLIHVNPRTFVSAAHDTMHADDSMKLIVTVSGTPLACVHLQT